MKAASRLIRVYEELKFSDEVKIIDKVIKEKSSLSDYHNAYDITRNLINQYPKRNKELNKRIKSLEKKIRTYKY